MADPTTRCPQCGAPLPVVANGLEILCPYCQARARTAGGSPVRRLLLLDRGSPEQARALLRQALAARFETSTDVVGAARALLVPCWSVVTAEGEMHTGPATRLDEPLLRALTLPSLPARPLAADEALPPEAAPIDLPLPDFLARCRLSPETTLDRAWLVWVPARMWPVRIGARRCRALTIADQINPILEPCPSVSGEPRLDWSLLLPLASWTVALIGLALLLPLPLYAGISAALTAILLLLWRPFAPPLSSRDWRRR